MPRVTVAPEVFSFVAFDAGRIRELVEEVAAKVRLPADLDLHVEVDEATPFGRSSTVIAGDTPGPPGISGDAPAPPGISGDAPAPPGGGRRVEISVEGGAFEDPQNLRRLSEPGTRQVLGRLLFRILDRLDPSFGSPPPDPELTLEQHATWDTYAVGRYARLAGIDGGQARRRYAFRLRHGFTDVADRAFEQLWYGSGLSWADLESIGQATRMAGGAA
jgi:hypothetical protein